MTICKFWQQGTCKFGNSCRFEHPNGAQRNQGGNRFGALDGGSSGGGSQNGLLEKYNISLDTVRADLTADVPQWILSAYAPGRDAPEQLFGGFPREQSFEEMRMHYLNGKAAGNEQGAINEAQTLYKNAEDQMRNILNNLRDAANFVVNAENTHPNRHDICRQNTQGQPFGEFLVGKRSVPTAAGSAQVNPFSSGASSQQSAFGGGGTATATGNAFGQPSALGQKPNPFGQPSQPTSTFGQPSQPAQTANPFGSSAQQPSGFAQAGAGFGQPAFGQPSQPAQTQGSAFGQPSQMGAKPSAFGAPSFGQTSQPNTQGSTFGQPSQPGAQGSAFGQPSQLGQKPNPFGSTQSTAGASPFGSTSNTGGTAPNPFGSAPAAPAQNNATPNPFGATPNTQAQPAANPFGQISQSSSGFGQPSQPAANPFASSNAASNQGAANPFGKQPTQASPFGSNQQAPNGNAGQQGNAPNPFQQNNAATPSPFGQPSGQSTQSQPAQTQGQSNAAAPSESPYLPDSTRQHPPIDSYATKAMDGTLATFRGKSVAYKDGKPGIRQFDGSWQRIWFPNGPPGFNKDTALPPDRYDDKTKAQWAAFAESGTFADGLMPELPPPRDCTLWNF